MLVVMASLHTPSSDSILHGLHSTDHGWDIVFFPQKQDQFVLSPRPTKAIDVLIEAHDARQGLSGGKVYTPGVE